MSAQILTLVGTLCGALFGFAAPLFGAAFARKDKEAEVQRQIASDVMGLFQDPEPLSAALTAQDSPTRRKLYLLALRLADDSARQACMQVIACAGQDNVSDGDLTTAWNDMMARVGAVYRRTRKVA